MSVFNKVRVLAKIRFIDKNISQCNFAERNRMTVLRSKLVASLERK